MYPTNPFALLFFLSILILDRILYRLGLRKSPKYSRSDEEEAKMNLQLMRQERMDREYKNFIASMAEYIGEEGDPQKVTEKSLRELFYSQNH